MANMLRHLDVSNYEEHPRRNNTCRIACRFCNQDFMSNQALINHMESHIAQEEGAIRRLYSPHRIKPQRELISRRFQPNFPMPWLLQETRDFAEYGRIFDASPPQQPMEMPLPRRNPFGHVVASQLVPQIQHAPQNIFSLAGNNVAGTSQFPTLPIHQMKMEESPIDGTKAYIKQLEKPIKKIEFIDLVGMEDDDDNSDDLQTLNLSLKL